MTSRRSFLEQSALSALGLALPVQGPRTIQPTGSKPSGFLDLRRPPDTVQVETTSATQTLTQAPSYRWTSADITVTTEPGPALNVKLTAPGTAVKRIRFRWRGTIPGNPLILGDAWERG